MCGRYILHGPVSRLTQAYGVARCPDFAPRYNIPPQSDILVVRRHPELGRVGQMVRWGLVPNWARHPSIGARLINARAEGIASKPSFRSSFARHRCLIPADGFYEWRSVSQNGKVRKQPYLIRPKGTEDFFAFAGLLAHWRPPDGEDLVSACIITTSANEVVAPIHDRMPAILSATDFDDWLAADNTDPEALQALLKPAPPESMEAIPVGTAVNRADNEGPELIQPIVLDD